MWTRRRLTFVNTSQTRAHVHDMPDVSTYVAVAALAFYGVVWVICLNGLRVA